jgi:hypothetical protein
MEVTGTAAETQPATTRCSRFRPYEFVVVSSLRAHQLMSGCVARVDGRHKATTMAQKEVAGGKVRRLGVGKPGDAWPASDTP